jgi:hypothetical protein
VSVYTLLCFPSLYSIAMFVVYLYYLFPLEKNEEIKETGE